jgi:hypothetical protein
MATMTRRSFIEMAVALGATAAWGYAALLNQGYGTEQSGVRQSIAILDLSTNQLRDFPDERVRGDEKTTLLSYFIGLAFSSDGKHLYASMSSITQNAIAVSTPWRACLAFLP